MSWWIKNVESFHKEPDATYTTKLANILCDTPEDLPQYNSQQLAETDPFILVYGSTAQVISTGRTYILNGSNQWVIQPQSGGGESSADQVSYDNTDSGLTATNVQDAIDELKDLDDIQDRGLSDLHDENANQQLEIDYAINTGAKNVLKNTAQYGELVRTNITFTHNSDDTYLVNAENPNTAITDLYVAANITLEPGDYILTGCPAGGDNNSTYKLQLAGIGYDTGNGFRFTITQTRTVSIYIRIWAGYVPNGLVFSPMLRPASITDSTFAPYAPTNRELYETKVSKEELYPSDNRTRDINTAKAPGTYRFYGNNATANLPTDITVTSAFGLLQVFTVNVYIVQVLVHFTSSSAGQEMPDIYVRRSTDSGSAWSPWNKLQGTSVASASTQSVNQVSTLNLSRNDLNESLDTNFDLIDSIPEEEEGEEDD